MILDIQLIKLWFKWKTTPYHWNASYYKSCYKVRQMDILRERIRKQVESKYKWLFMQLNLDFDKYKELMQIKQQEIDDLVTKAWTS